MCRPGRSVAVLALVVVMIMYPASCSGRGGGIEVPPSPPQAPTLSRRAALAYVAAAAATGGTAPSTAQAEADGCLGFAAAPATDLQPLLGLPREGFSGPVGQAPPAKSGALWLGADSDTSMRLTAAGAHLWLFGDTLLGQYDAAAKQRVWPPLAMPHQTVAVATGVNTNETADWSATHYWASTTPGGGAPRSLFNPHAQADASYYCETLPAMPNKHCDFIWVVSGQRVGMGSSAGTPAAPAPGSLVLLAPRIVDTPGKGLGFGIAGTTAVAVDNPDDPPPQWRYRVGNFSHTGPVVDNTVGSVNWYSAVAFAQDPNMPDLVYILGSTRFAGVLARANLSSLAATLDESSFEYWVDAPGLHPGVTLPTNCGVTHHEGGEASVSCWKPGVPDPVTLTPVVSPPVSETTLAWSDELQRWYMPIIPPFSTSVQLFTAPNVTGPWSSTEIYTIPPPLSNTTRDFCYAAKSHPELQRPGRKEMVLTYVCNGWHIDTLFKPNRTIIYTPQFLRVTTKQLCVTPLKPLGRAGCGRRCALLIVGISVPLLVLCTWGIGIYVRRMAKHRAQPEWRREQMRLQIGSPSPELLYRRM